MKVIRALDLELRPRRTTPWSRWASHPTPRLPVSVTSNADGRVTAVLGLKDVVVVNTATATLVCAKERVQDIKKLLQKENGR